MKYSGVKWEKPQREVRSSQVKSSQVKSSQVKSSQVKSSQVSGLRELRRSHPSALRELRRSDWGTRPLGGTSAWRPFTVTGPSVIFYKIPNWSSTSAGPLRQVLWIMNYPGNYEVSSTAAIIASPSSCLLFCNIPLGGNLHIYTTTVTSGNMLCWTTTRNVKSGCT